MDHLAFSRKGGKARSLAKTVANRAKAAAYWNAVRAGRRPAPRRAGPALDAVAVARLLAGCCRRRGIVLLEAFGPLARGACGRGGGVDLLATFSPEPALGPAAVEAEMASILGAPVRLLERGAVELMANPFRRASILADARAIYRDA